MSTQQHNYELRRQSFFSIPFVSTIVVITYFWVLALIVMKAVAVPIGIAWYVAYAGVLVVVILANIAKPKFHHLSFDNIQITYPQRFLFGRRRVTRPLWQISTVEHKRNRSPVLFIGLGGSSPCVIRSKDLHGLTLSEIHDSLWAAIQSSDHAGDISRRVAQAEEIRQGQRKPPYASIGLSLFMVAVYIYGILRIPSGNIGERILAEGALFCIGSPTIDLYRIFSSMFIHATLPFLIADVAIIVVIGLRIERLVGAARYLLVFLGGGLIANVSAIWFASAPVIVGASGGIFALFGLYLIILKRYGNRLPSTVQFFSNFWFAVLLIFMLIPPTAKISGITHLFGLLAGILLALLMFAGNSYRRRAIPTAAALITSLSVIAVIFSMYKMTDWPVQKAALETRLLSARQLNRNGVMLAIGLLEDQRHTDEWQRDHAIALLSALPHKTAREWKSLGALQLTQGRVAESILADRQALATAAGTNYSISDLLRTAMHLPNLQLPKYAQRLVDAEQRFSVAHGRPYGIDGTCGKGHVRVTRNKPQYMVDGHSVGDCEVDAILRHPDGSYTLMVFDTMADKTENISRRIAIQSQGWKVSAVFANRTGSPMSLVVPIPR